MWLLEPLQPRVDSSKVLKKENWFPANWTDGYFNKTLYAISYRGGVSGLYYNVALFRKAGLDPDRPPVVRDPELLNAALKLTNAAEGVHGYGMPASAKSDHIVADSLMAIKKLVFDEKKISFADLKRAVDTNFENDPAIRALVTKKVPLFGSGSDAAVAMADRIAKFAHDHYWNRPHYRGGHYTVGFWSMSNHVAYGTLSGALPSGRLAGKAFTPGLTPEPNASKNLLDNIRDVARLNWENINNNIAFNVKVVPHADDSREKTIDDIFSYVKTYFDLGGMQMQLSVVTSETLKDAMAHPENYRNLLVRISGYNAYFVTLNRDMQIELIERAEYGV